MTTAIIGNHQDLFNRVCAHLAAQGTLSRKDDGMCCYRDVSGKRCAIGCLLPDDAPFAYLDDAVACPSQAISDLIQRGIIVTTADPDFLTLLQEAHDQSISAGGLRSALRTLAEQFDLDAKDVDLITRWEVQR